MAAAALLGVGYMRLMVINRDSEIGGGVTYVRHLTTALTSQGWQVSYAAPPGKMRPVIKASGARILNQTFFTILQTPLLVRFLRRHRPDVVDSQSRGTSAVIAPACRIAKVPWVATMHGPIQSHKFAGPTERALKAANAVVSLDIAVGAHYWDLGVPAKQIFSSHLFIPWRESAPAKAQGIHLCYCSRLSSKKGKRGLAFVQAAAKMGHEVTVVGAGKFGKEIAEAGGKMVGQTLDPKAHFERANVVGGAGFVAIEAIEAGCVPVGMGFSGCLGSVNPENLVWAADRNYGDHGGTRGYDASVESMERELRLAIDQVSLGRTRELRQEAEKIHSLEINGPKVHRFLAAIAEGRSFEGFGDDVTRFLP